jgi:hypothetical protein
MSVETLEIDAAVNVDLDGDACGFLKKEDDDETIGRWQICHAKAAAPRPIPSDIVINDMAQAEWREDTAARIKCFGRARKAMLIKFEVTEGIHPAEAWHLYLRTDVT